MKLNYVQQSYISLVVTNLVIIKNKRLSDYTISIFKIPFNYIFLYFMVSEAPLVQWFDQGFINAFIPGDLSFNSRRRWNYVN